MNTSTRKNDTIIKAIQIGWILALVIFCLSMFYVTGKFIHIMLLWNIFLSYIPFYVSKKLSKKKSLRTLLLWIIWLLFIPNAFYMITDFVHIQQIGFIEVFSPYQSTWIKNITMWLELSNISICILTGIAFGVMSMEHIHDVLGRKLYRILLPIFAIINGFAIFMGRFLRLNSWDILHPMSLFQKLFSNLDAFAIEFTLLIAIFFLFVNVGYFLIKHSFHGDKQNM